MKVPSSPLLRAATQGMLTCHFSRHSLPSSAFCGLRFTVAHFEVLMNGFFYLFSQLSFGSSFYYPRKYLKCFTIKNRVLVLSKEARAQICPFQRRRGPVASDGCIQHSHLQSPGALQSFCNFMDFKHLSLIICYHRQSK